MNFFEQITQRIDNAVAQADTTKKVIIGSNVISRVPSCFKDCFENAAPVMIADKNTYCAAGQAVTDAFVSAGRKMARPLILEDDDLYAEYRFAERVADYLKTIDAIPVAVGSGTINDLVKLASHMCGRKYMTVATAASMDGYTAFGASVTKDGFKQTMFCPAPIAVVADVNIIENAPSGMNASGYADLVAKIPAGADWIVADALGIEPIDDKAWTIVQPSLRTWIDNPEGIRRNDKNALARLIEGLIMSGLAMQASRSSRPASGAEHQFSHLWDNEHHIHNGIAPSHGIKVGIGTICSEALYANILNYDQREIETEPTIIKNWWPRWETVDIIIKCYFTEPFLANQVVEQSKAKYVNIDSLSKRLAELKSIWPELKNKLRNQLLGPGKTQEMLKIAGAASLPIEIGINYDRLCQSFRCAQLIRKRYTVLDLALETGWWNRCVNSLFSENGFWNSGQRKEHKFNLYQRGAVCRKTQHEQQTT